MRCTYSPLPHKTNSITRWRGETSDKQKGERERERERGGRIRATAELLSTVSPPLSWQCLGGSAALFKNPAPGIFFSPFHSFPEFKSTKKLFFFFNIHVRISIVEILGLVLFLGWFYSCLFDFLRFYRAVAFEYAIELFD